MVRALPFVVARVSDRLEIIDVSGATSHALLGPGAAPGQSIDVAMAPQLAGPLRAVAADLLRSEGQAHRFDVVLHAEHSEITVVRAAPAELLVIVRAVTDERNAAARMARALAEKEALLREIHHRVKNNLQMVTSLMRLQTRSETSPAALAEKAESRIQALALVHEQLYQSDDLARIDLEAYLRTLTARLVFAYAGRGSAVDVEVRATARGIGIDQAIPLGLIVSEAVSNSMKHGLAGRSRGRVVVELATEEGEHRLRVSDDGCGLRPQSGRAQSLGLRLVHQLGRQLGGTVAVRDVGAGGGAEVLVAFPVVCAPAVAGP
jgi:two-component sensor histidine kinase